MPVLNSQGVSQNGCFSLRQRDRVDDTTHSGGRSSGHEGRLCWHRQLLTQWTPVTSLGPSANTASIWPPPVAEEAKSPPLASLRTTGWSQRLHCHLAEGMAGTNSVHCSESTFSTRNQTPCRLAPGTTGGPGDPLRLSLTISVSHRVRTPHRGKRTQAAGRHSARAPKPWSSWNSLEEPPQRSLLLKRTRAGVARSPDGHGCRGGTIAPACMGAQACRGALRTRCSELRTFRSQ